MEEKKVSYIKLFFSMLYLSTFTFGGGYVIIALMQKKFVDKLQWLGEEEMLEIAAIAQSSPGAVAVNASILVGYKVKGILGALVSFLGTIIPPLVIITVISFFYTYFKENTIIQAFLKGMQSAVAAVVIDVVLSLGAKVIKERKALNIIIMIAVFALTYFFKLNVIYVILACGVIGFIRAIIKIKKDKTRGQQND